MDSKEQKKNSIGIEMQTYSLHSDTSEESVPVLPDIKGPSLQHEKDAKSESTPSSLNLKNIDTLTLSDMLVNEYLQDNPLDLSELFDFDLIGDLTDELSVCFEKNKIIELMRTSYADLKPYRQETKFALIELTERAFTANIDPLAQVTLCHLIIHQKVTCSIYRARQLYEKLAEINLMRLIGLKTVLSDDIYRMRNFLALLISVNISALDYAAENNIELLYHQLKKDQRCYVEAINKHSLTAYLAPSILKKTHFILEREAYNDTYLLFAILRRFSAIADAFRVQGIGNFRISTLLEIAKRALPICEKSAQETFEIAVCAVLICRSSNKLELKEAQRLILEGMQKKDPTSDDWLNYCKIGKHFEWAYFHALPYKDQELAYDFIFHAVKFYQMSQQEEYLAQLGPSVIRLFTIKHVIDDEKSNHRIKHSRYLQLLKEQYPEIYRPSIQNLLLKKYPSSQSTERDLDIFIQEQLQEDSLIFTSQVNWSLAGILEESQQSSSTSEFSRTSFNFLNVHSEDLMAEASYPPKELADQIKSNIQRIFPMEKIPADQKKQKSFHQEQVDDFLHYLEDNIKQTFKLINCAIDPDHYIDGVQYIHGYCDRRKLSYSALSLTILEQIKDEAQRSFVWTTSFPSTEAELIMIAFVDLKKSMVAAPAQVADLKKLKKPSVTHQVAPTPALSHFRPDEKLKKLSHEKTTLKKLPEDDELNKREETLAVPIG